MAYVERCGSAWRAHWLLADGVHCGSRSGFAARLAAKRFAEDREAGLASSTMNVVMTVVRDLLTDAAAERLIAAPPAFRTGRRRRRVPEDWRPGVVVDLTTVQAVRARLGREESLLVLVAVFTGMRWGEACGMRRSLLTLERGRDGHAAVSGWYAIDPLAGAVHEDVHARRYFGPPKGGRGRVVDLPPFLAKRLLRHIAGMGERDLLFPDRHGQARRHTDWLRVWRPACDGRPVLLAVDGRVLEPDMPPICRGLRLQDLRHTHKTMLIELGVPDVLQDERLGHRPASVQGVYAHATPAMRARLIEGLQQLWKQHRRSLRARGEPRSG